jgi:hypothetical protein
MENTSTTPSSATIPSNVSFMAKPSPPRALNNLRESGRIRLTVYFEDLQNVAETSIKGVIAKITNNTKLNNMHKLKTAMENDNLKTNDQGFEDIIPYSSTELVQKELNTWYGEIPIPCNWFEGGSKTFERTGSFSPHFDDNLFTMNISCALGNNDSVGQSKFVIEAHSTDVFHWA